MTTTKTIHRVMELVAHIHNGPSQREIEYLFLLGNEWHPVQPLHFNLEPTKDENLLKETFPCDFNLMVLAHNPQQQFFIKYINGMRRLTFSEKEPYDMSSGFELSLCLQHEHEKIRAGLFAWYDPLERKGWLFRTINE